MTSSDSNANTDAETNDSAEVNANVNPFADLEARRAEALNTFSWWKASVKELFDAYAAGVRDFRRIEIVGANLIGANLRSANLIGANLRSANLDGANLIGANLIGANLRSANLIGANLRSANLIGANLDGANLRSANLIGANLIGANLDGANLIGANLIGANLDGANLIGANSVASAGPVGETGRIIYGFIHEREITVQLGCFQGTWDEGMEAIREKYDDDEYRKWLPEYEAAMLYIKARLTVEIEALPKEKAPTEAEAEAKTETVTETATSAKSDNAPVLSANQYDDGLPF